MGTDMNYIKKGIPFMLLIFLLLPSVSVLAKEQMDERVYYILVDRFVNGDNNNDIEIDIDNPEAYYGGDFQGIIDKLSNLQKLGITTINLSPIMVASSYNGFDPVDYQSVDPQFGDMADLQQLVAEAHENDMEVVLDFPITHVAENHSWTSENTDWIKDASTNQLEEQLPAINLDSQEVQEYFLETAVYWMKSANVDGFHIYVNDQIPELFIEQLRERIFNEDEQATLIIDGMETEVGSSMLPSFRTEAVTILKQPGQSVEPLLRNELTGVHYLESVLTPRFAHEAVQAGFNPVTRWQLASTLLYTLPGGRLFSIRVWKCQWIMV
ncbi:glucan 1,6-alpha-glucosidase [Gracilibacillus boraciitolerans JCM 21714]|uniref:Glucan 1,6-alpha-glucosidase n=2 Tax=Gracilibacillus boraciitolerans TaxID=307521 RepID=W4VKD8_9BACI|nr:glucan 1,6-alpha-glucosidase [Gracilibacillus boraciitolerans JCM 21714]